VTRFEQRRLEGCDMVEADAPVQYMERTRHDDRALGYATEPRVKAAPRTAGIPLRRCTLDDYFANCADCSSR